MRKGETPCFYCSQRRECGMRDSPNTLSGIMEGKIRIPANPVGCFFYCCPTGQLEALKKVRRARQEGERGFLPFGSEDKPFIKNGSFSGRYVTFGAEELGFQDFTVVVRLGSRVIPLTHLIRT